MLNKSAMHAVFSSLLQSRKFWWYLLLTSLMLLHDVIVTSYCSQWYAECLVTTCVRAGQCTGTPRRARATVELLRHKTPTFLASTCGLQTQSCGLWDLGCHAASCLPQTNPQCGWIETVAHQCLAQSWTVDFWWDHWPVARKTSSVCPC